MTEFDVQGKGGKSQQQMETEINQQLKKEHLGATGLFENMKTKDM